MRKEKSIKVLESLGITCEEIYTEAKNQDIEITDEKLEKIANYVSDSEQYFEARNSVLLSALKEI